MLRDFVKHVVRKFEERQTEIGGNMAAGQCTDWAAYNKLVGKCSAFAEAIEIIEKAERMTVDEEDRDSTD